MVKDHPKVWCCLFTCLSIRAIHLEVAESLSSESFVRAFRRFVARRGKPSVIISDNGKNFILARKLLEPSLQKNPLRSAEYETFLKNNKIKWSLITERSPWKGGFFERLVGSVKRHLRRVVGNSYLTLPELNTILIEIEYVVNCRPLTFVSDRLENVHPIRPIDFLSPNVNTQILSSLSIVYSELSKNSNKESLTLYWQRSQEKLDLFWKKWTTDYLLSLRERAQKVSDSKQPLTQNDDIVLIYEENLPRNHWRLAIVKGNDNITENTRSLKVKLSSGKTIKRSVSQLYPIDTTYE